MATLVLMDYIPQVIGVTKLRQKFPTHEHKRDLCGQYDIFMADERVLPMLPRLLGKTFFDKKKYGHGGLPHRARRYSKRE